MYLFRKETAEKTTTKSVVWGRTTVQHRQQHQQPIVFCPVTFPSPFLSFDTRYSHQAHTRDSRTGQASWLFTKKKANSTTIMSQTMTKATGNGEGSRRLQRLFGIVILFITIGFICWDAMQAEHQNPLDTKSKTTGVKRTSEADVRCHFVCQERRKIRLQKFNGVDLLDSKQVLHAVFASKAKMVNTIKKGYGEEYFTKIFVDPEDSSIHTNNPGRRTAQQQEQQQPPRRQEVEGANPIRYRGIDPVNSTGDSVNRLHRKLLMKFVQAQAELRKVESNLDGCDCIHGDKAIGGISTADNTTTSYWNVNSTYAKFVWATGGHSASAGHGNLFNETYTAFMERAVKDVFAAMGVGFEGRNYAMGGTK
jgi:hypothetical protein